MLILIYKNLFFFTILKNFVKFLFFTQNKKHIAYFILNLIYLYLYLEPLHGRQHSHRMLGSLHAALEGVFIMPLFMVVLRDMNIWKTLFGDESTQFIKEAKPLVARINELEALIGKLSDSDFPAETAKLKNRFEMGETLDELLPEAFALVREASRRTRGERHYDAQLFGGVALHKGSITEMKTGEGKTLVATLPAYLNALSGKGVHIVTVNDYLAKRDATDMGQVYAFLGLTTGIINDQFKSYVYDVTHTDKQDDVERDETATFKVAYEFLRPVSKKEAYDCDIVYGTNSQFGFDYLRDNTVRTKEQLVQREHNFAIVDEVDSILIDEARVPLILSAAAEDAGELYVKFAQLARTLSKDVDYTVDEKLHAIQITLEGIQKVEKMLGVENLYTSENITMAHHLENAIRARALYLNDRDYVVRGNEVIIVDTFTGRMQEGRRWSDGLHQAIEAKEGVMIQQESRTLASITYQNYFKQYTKISGMTGTAMTSEEEFRSVYGLDVLVIPTHRPLARFDLEDLIYINQEAKWRAIARTVKELNKNGQPVLIGTVSIEKNELLSAFLKQEGVPHQVLNAKNHENEGEIIAMGGIKGAVTVATNMAGRGVDIKLGGPKATKEEADEIRELGGLYVIGTERHEARRIDNQLRGRSGRQGDPGVSQFYVALDDDLMRIFGGDKMQGMMTSMNFPIDEAIQNSFISKNIERAQDQIEGQHFDSRKHTLSYDDILAKHRTGVYNRRRNLLLRDEAAVESLKKEVELTNPELAPQLVSKQEELGIEVYNNIFISVALQTLDRLWMEHLEIMDQSRRSVGLRAYGQREPLVEYAKEGFRLYKELEQVFLSDVASFVSRIDVGEVRNEIARLSQQVEVTAIDDNAQAPKSDESNSSSHATSKEDITLTKNGETKIVKRKKMQSWLDAGWKEII